ncbi:AmmeMemoRadiSam system protein B [bacterium]|nr:AmmeMemoRadiSam system protein B [bacterium]
MQLGFLGTAEAENEQADNYYLNMKILGPNNEVIRDADISWLALKDGVGPMEEFKILFKDENYSIELPGVGVYFFTINAEGYETVEKKEIKIKEKIENITIILGKKHETSSEHDVFGPVGRSDFWYPATEGDLRRMVDSFLDKAGVEELEGRVVAVIAPHAGFRYSGQCAAFSFKPLIKQKLEKVIILAPSHVGGFRGLSILKADYYKTPLGLIKVDVGVCESLLKERLINTIPYAHTKEHSLENMLPFLQRTLNEFKLVPIIVGHLSDGDYEILANSIKKYIDVNTLIVVSSDFTHYGRDHYYLPFPLNKDTRQNIEELDRGAIDRIVNVDFVGFQQYLAKTGATICGRIPIGLLLKILPGDAKGQLVYYYMSGDFTGNYRSSVSYGSIVFYR